MLKLNNFSNFILKNISISLNSENLVILGSNGAGKSTLAKVLTNLIPNEKIIIDNMVLSLTHPNERRKLINYIPSKLEIFDEYMSVEEFLTLSKIYTNYSVDKVLKLLKIEHLREKSCKSLSSGESQLLLIASSILHGAKYTILDEPTSNLDQKRVVDIFNLIKSDNLFQNRVIITHDINFAYKLGYKILYLENGEVKFFNESKIFFQKENLDYFFGNSVKRVKDCFVINI